MASPAPSRPKRRPEDVCPIDPPTGPHPRRWGVVLRFGIAAVAFLLVNLVLRAIATPAGGDMIGSKVQHYERAAERYDTIFLGTSHVYRSFVPEEFDRALREDGVTSTSFNYGIQLPNQVELHYLLRRALADGEGHLRRVFVQYCGLMPQVDPEQAFKARHVYWHDRTGTQLAIDRAWELDRAAGEGIDLAPDPKRRHAVLAIAERWMPSRVYLARQHFQHYVKREMLVARNKDVARGLLGRPHSLLGQWRATQGYVPLERDAERRAREGGVNAFALRRQALRDGLEDYLAHVARLKTEDTVWGDQEWMNAQVQRLNDFEVYRSMAQLAADAGVELIVVVMPSNSCARTFEERMEAELGVPVLRYNRPDVYPRFYEPDLRFDAGHLSQDGAIEFTRVLARNYLSLRRGE